MAFDWKDALRSVAPTLATAFGGPLAGTATTFLSDWLLGRKDGTEAELAKLIISASPDMLLKLKEADFAFASKMKELDVQIEEIHERDRESARQRQVQVKDKMPAVIAAGTFLTLLTVMAGLFFRAIPEASQPVFFAVVGAFVALATQVGQFYFGSSKGSEAKNAMIDKFLNGGNGK